MELKTAEEALGKDLADIYRREYQRLTDRDADLLYMPATDRAKWWCSCGVMNLISQMHCRVCGASIADLSRIMWKDYLLDIYERENPGKTPEEPPKPVVAEPEPEPVEEPVPEPEPELMPAVEPIDEEVAEPAVEAVPEIEPVDEAVTEIEPEAVAESVEEPVPEPETESMPAVEPIDEEVAEPVVEAVPEIESVDEAVTEIEPEAVVELESVEEPLSEPEPEPVVEPVVEAVPETEPVDEAVADADVSVPGEWKATPEISESHGESRTVGSWDAASYFNKTAGDDYSGYDSFMMPEAEVLAEPEPMTVEATDVVEDAEAEPAVAEAPAETETPEPVTVEATDALEEAEAEPAAAEASAETEAPEPVTAEVTDAVEDAEPEPIAVEVTDAVDSEPEVTEETEPAVAPGSEVEIRIPTAGEDEEENEIKLPTAGEDEDTENELKLPTAGEDEEENELKIPTAGEDEEENELKLPTAGDDEEEEAKLDIQTASASDADEPVSGIITSKRGDEEQEARLDVPVNDEEVYTSVLGSDVGTEELPDTALDASGEDQEPELVGQQGEIVEGSADAADQDMIFREQYERMDIEDLAGVKDEPDSDSFEFTEQDTIPDEPDDDLPMIVLEEATEMPGFGAVQTMDAKENEDSADFYEPPSDDDDDSPKEKKKKKSGLFGGLFGSRDKKPKKKVKRSQISAVQETSESEIRVQESPMDIPDKAPEPEFDTTFEPESDTTPEQQEPDITPEPEPDIAPEPVAEDLPVIELETPDKLTDMYVHLAEGEISDDFSADDQTEEPTDKQDDQDIPYIVFPEDEAVDNIGDELDFPDATIPETPMPDPEIPKQFDESLPRIEFPDEPVQEITMNPEPENKEKARPFRNPGAAEETPSGIESAGESVPVLAEAYPEEPQPEQPEPRPEEASAQPEPEPAEAQPAPEPEQRPEAAPAQEPDPAAAAPQPAPEPESRPEEVSVQKSANTSGLLLTAAIVIALAVIVVVGFLLVKQLFGDGGTGDAIGAANASIAKLAESEIPTQEDFNKALSDYNAVPYDQRNGVENAEILERYKDVDLKLVRDIDQKIDSLNEQSPFSDVIDTEEHYDRLTTQEKQFVDGEKLNGLKTLSELETTALQAVTCIKSLISDAEDFKVLSVAVKDDTKMSISYRMKINYSYVDAQGTLNNNTTYISMLNEQDDVAYQKALNADKPELYTKSTEDKEAYDSCESEEVSVDSEKLMYFMQ